jgi:restriction system protein
MTVPSFDRFVEPLLRLLAANPSGVNVSEAYAKLADQLGLTEQDRAALLPSGNQPVYENRIGWARDRLRRAEYMTSPRRGWWQITDSGKAFVASHKKPLTEQELRAITVVPRKSGTVIPEEPDVEAGEAQAQGPTERIEAALKELRESVSHDLLDVIGQSSPQFFERLVLDLLHTMGYGTSRSELQHVGGSGDGGIDGIISLDRLGLEKVYIQAKRWGRTVGRPEVQGFYGALAGRRANKGVFITTSNFTREAIDFANQVEKIVLVDGDRLTALMIDHGVGVTNKAFNVPKVDGDYFDEV